jgi:uncharacterized protein DUF4395
MSQVVSNFMKQQGFPEEPPDACNLRFQGLYFQPRIVFPLVVLAILLQSQALFFAVSVVLFWNVLVPRLNPFELAYNWFVARPRGTLPLTPAPWPRRFAQGMAGLFTLGAGWCLLRGFTLAAWVFEGFLVVAFGALLFGKFCLGAWVFHVLRGEAVFANSTLPWARKTR